MRVLIMKLAVIFKPVLVKLLPDSFLKRIRGNIFEKEALVLANADVAPFERAAFDDGINLIGDVQTLTGLGQSCRLVAQEILASQTPLSVYNFQVYNRKHKDNSFDYFISKDMPYSINIFHVNPPDLPYIYAELKNSFNRHYNIAYWLWELEELPESWAKMASIFNEIWTASEFCAESMRKKIDIPVHVIPYAVNVTVDENADRKFFSLPENMFLVLSMYDTLSSADRKNPIGSIKAFRKAFKNSPNVGLVLKMHNPTQEDMLLIKKETEGCENIFIIDNAFDKKVLNSLIQCVDVFISLHRSEGFGLVLAEAMSLGTVCVATNWSGNVDFMNSDVACMVDYSFITIKKDTGYYHKGDRWADPDIDQAAGYLQKLYKDPEYKNSLAVKAKEYISDKLKMEKIAALIKARVNNIL